MRERKELKELPNWRESTYKEEYCDELIKYYLGAEEIPIRTPQGDIAVTKEGVPITEASYIPSKYGFAARIGVHKDTLTKWAKKNPEFGLAMKVAFDIGADKLINFSMKKLVDKSVGIFMLKNITDLEDKKSIEVTERKTINDFYSEHGVNEENED